MPLLWRDEMNVDNNMVDSDHRYLFGLINNYRVGIEG